MVMPGIHGLFDTCVVRSTGLEAGCGRMALPCRRPQPCLGDAAGGGTLGAPTGSEVPAALPDKLRNVVGSSRQAQKRWRLLPTSSETLAALPDQLRSKKAIFHPSWSLIARANPSVARLGADELSRALRKHRPQFESSSETPTALCDRLGNACGTLRVLRKQVGRDLSERLANCLRRLAYGLHPPVRRHKKGRTRRPVQTAPSPKAPRGAYAGSAPLLIPGHHARRRIGGALAFPSS